MGRSCPVPIPPATSALSIRFPAPARPIALGSGGPTTTEPSSNPGTGAVWSITPSPNNGDYDNSLSGVTCSSPTYCVAVGGAPAEPSSNPGMVRPSNRAQSRSHRQRGLAEWDFLHQSDHLCSSWGLCRVDRPPRLWRSLGTGPLGRLSTVPTPTQPIADRASRPQLDQLRGGGFSRQRRSGRILGRFDLVGHVQPEPESPGKPS